MVSEKEENYFETYRRKIQLTKILLVEICFLSFTVLDMSLRFSSSYAFIFVFIIMLATIDVSLSPLFLSDGSKIGENSVLERIKPCRVIFLIIFGTLIFVSDLTTWFSMYNPLYYRIISLMLILFSFFHLLIYGILNKKLRFFSIASFVMFLISLFLFALGMFAASNFVLSVVYLLNAFITAHSV